MAEQLALQIPSSSATDDSECRKLLSPPRLVVCSSYQRLCRLFRQISGHTAHLRTFRGKKKHERRQEVAERSELFGISSLVGSFHQSGVKFFLRHSCYTVQKRTRKKFSIKGQRPSINSIKNGQQMALLIAQLSKRVRLQGSGTLIGNFLEQLRFFAIPPTFPSSGNKLGWKLFT